MKFKKTLLAFCLIMCIFFCVSSVAAGDVNNTIGVSDDNQIELSQDLINDMKEEDNLKSNEIDEILTENPKTFSSLNATINGNDDTDVYLDSNYTFELGSDSDFKDGVVIGRAVTVRGNGFTISGDNAARIFTVTNSNVVFKDIVFVNGKTSVNGGAIDGECTVVNCTFNSNSAECGGAMYKGSAVNCTFINNGANYCGGAMYFGSAVNCTFIGNFAITYGNSYGGAMDECSAVNCTFKDNKGQCGIFSRSTAINCTFDSNSASYGGAIYGGFAVNCTFRNNKAKYDGGAMCGNGYTATNCQFINNTANNGGATYQITANNCNFTKNTVTEYGGAMYEGSVINSNFLQNYANKEGGAAYDSLVANCLFEYNSAENGGAMSRGRATMCTFNNNNATNYGGAVYSAKISTNSKFNNNIALNGTATDNVTWFDNLNGKSFFDLNVLINNNTDSDIYLNSNYTFDLMSDSDFKDGVVIGRAVTVHGNGFTISGDNAARIFTVTNSNVVFKDIVFVNGKTSVNGGAIDGECTVVNCTFNSNSAECGGAMYKGSAVNCTFINNGANYCGGAMYFGSAVNCTFIGNFAITYGNSYGGAMDECSAVNCTFKDNKGQCGIFSRSTAINCTFDSNSASYGGAIYGGFAVNCTFRNNKAKYDGGAMCGNGYTATNCQFINNTANNGGATYQITANNCQFINNTASEYGGAMYEGTANNCIFKDNKAGISGDNTYNTNVPKPNLIVYNFTSTYNSGNKLLFNFTTASGTPINNVNITIRVYKNNALVGTYYALSGEGWVVNLDVGSYIAVCSVENQAYEVEPANATLTIKKLNTNIAASAVTTVYNGGKYLVITLKDSAGKKISGVKLTVVIGSKTYKPTTDKNGQVKVSTNSLVPKKYTAKITFNGNTNYVKSTKSVKVTVKKATPKLTAKAKTFKKSVKTKNYVVTLKTNQNKVMKKAKLTMKVNGKTYSATTNAKGQATFKITKLTKKGTFTAVVKFAGNKYYNAKTVKPKITVK